MNLLGNHSLQNMEDSIFRTEELEIAAGFYLHSACKETHARAPTNLSDLIGFGEKKEMDHPRQ